ncbi:DUF4446 family protein [Candidatus Daviesbacteria bacterium]|nr:DUF4446 family protein [Candidatus Daviesbacteria bacterium]
MYPGGGAGAVGMIFFSLLLTWLIILSYLFWRERQSLRQLFPKSGERDIRTKLKEVLEAIEDFKRREDLTGRNIRSLARQGLSHMQRIAMLRFNPYDDTGGDQSFIIALLDGNLNGFILTSLHSRAGTRLYTKEITIGKSDLELSKEEKEVLKKAIEND